MSKLWDKKSANTDAGVKERRAQVEKFTVGQDREWDLYLAPFDVQGSIAHVQMLAETKLLKADVARTLVNGLRDIYREITSGKFFLEAGVEDVHSEIRRGGQKHPHGPLAKRSSFSGSEAFFTK